MSFSAIYWFPLNLFFYITLHWKCCNNHCHSQWSLFLVAALTNSHNAKLTWCNKTLISITSAHVELVQISLANTFNSSVVFTFLVCVCMWVCGTSLVVSSRWMRFLKLCAFLKLLSAFPFYYYTLLVYKMWAKLTWTWCFCVSCSSFSCPHANCWTDLLP